MFTIKNYKITEPDSCFHHRNIVQSLNHLLMAGMQFYGSSPKISFFSKKEKEIIK